MNSIFINFQIIILCFQLIIFLPIYNEILIIYTYNYIILIYSPIIRNRFQKYFTSLSNCLQLYYIIFLTLSISLILTTIFINVILLFKIVINILDSAIIISNSSIVILFQWKGANFYGKIF